MKRIIEKIVQQRNPNFKFDVNLDFGTLLQFIWIQTWCVIRGLKVLFFLRNPKRMMLGKGVSFFSMSKIKWGKFLRLGNYVYVSALCNN